MQALCPVKLVPESQLDLQLLTQVGSDEFVDPRALPTDVGRTFGSIRFDRTNFQQAVIGVAQQGVDEPKFSSAEALRPFFFFLTKAMLNVIS